MAHHALNAAGLKLDVPNLSDPEELLEYRERTITTLKDIIMYDPRGIMIGTYLFSPWSYAALAQDKWIQPHEPLKPLQELAFDYYVTLDQRGVRDSIVRHEIGEKVIHSLPQQEIFSDDDRDMMRLNLHSMTPLG